MPGRCVHHLVEAQASLTPHAAAVAWDGGTLTYRELDEWASQLANELVGRGVRPERLVAVGMEPSPQLMVTMLAIWKAGGVYVPIDPSLPRDTAEGMLADAGVAFLLRNGSAAPEFTDVPVVDLDEIDISGQPKSPPQVALDPANLAYCLFTSGSTGKPKPVAVAHASFANHAESLRDKLGLRPDDRVLQSTPIALDASLEEILPAWLGGATIVMPDERRFTSRELTALIERHAVTMASLASAYWHQWVDDLAAGLVQLPSCLRVLLIGGDKILADKLIAWSQVPGAKAIDWVADYGPTETTITVAHFDLDGTVSDEDLTDYGVAPIGRPFANATIHVLDEALRPVPDGAPGDFWVAGVPLARGYHASPAATADRFLPDPFGPPGARMYRSGDRGSRRPDGILTFLGRSDRQVKIRGHRVEPGQVESAVLRCTGVRDGVVITVDDPPFGSRLVAYVEAEPGVTEAAIRVDLAQRLPEVMVPQTIMFLDRVPRSPLSGKVTRSALPSPSSTRADRTDATSMTTLERVLAALVGDVLGGPPIDRDENFFAAGGDSLRALQLLSRVAEVTGVALTFAQLREAPTVAGIATLVTLEHGSGASDGTVVRAGSRTDRRPASRGQQALWFLDRVHRGKPVYVIPCCYRIRGPLDLDRLDGALTTIVARHEALRTVFEEQHGKVWQKIQQPTPMRTTVTDVADADEALRRAEEAASSPLDLTAGPLLKSACFRVGPEEHLWLLTVHHAVFDAWSLAVFWRELTALYAGRPLPEPATQFSDYSDWQERWLRGAEADKQRAYWRTQLAGDPTALELGSRRGAGGRVGTDGFTVGMPPGAVHPADVERVARDCGATTFAVLLAAFFAALRRTCGNADDVVIGAPVACRNRPGTENLIGYLANMVALRMRFTEGMSFQDLVRRTDEMLTDALTHQELPFADAVDGVARRGGPGQTPLFQAIFTAEPIPVVGSGDIEGIDGLDISETFIHSGTAKFALTWTLWPSTETSLTGELEYASDRFDETSAHRWQDSLLGLLSAGLADPGAAVDALPVAGALSEVLPAE